ncbi:Zn-dependent hydrolase [Altererythrobacter sp.]|uniref:Zn-dependent hydrolase n=1 Tax=Altererythrobacter sp. TaxID=1872480 RepID=UPI003D0350CC
MTLHPPLQVNSQRLLGDIDSLGGIGVDENGERTRPSFSPQYQEAVEWLIDRMRAAGLRTRIDAVGNVIGRMGPDNGPIVMTGSHIDTVRNGGPLDGSYGVLAGVEVAHILSENKLELAAPLEVVAFADEEGAYLSLFGSRALAGGLAAEEIETSRNWQGTSLFEAMDAYGFDPERYREAAYPAGAIQKFVELHIEQGPVLDTQGQDIGIVNGIVGMRNLNFRFLGKSNHAGTTPMDMRQDALRAAAEFITRAYTRFEEEGEQTARLTFGAIHVKPNMGNVIAREAAVRLDCRDLDDDRTAKIVDQLESIARQVALHYGIDADVEYLSHDRAAILAPDIMEEIGRAAEGLGLTSMVMPSGAGHDTQVMARICKAGMIFVPSSNGLSHHPDEWTDPQQLIKGANVLLHTMASFLMAKKMQPQAATR